MGCGESKLAVATADGALPRKKSSAGRSKSGYKAADVSKRGADAAVADLKVASEIKTEKKIDEEKIDGAVKIESENKTEQREEKKSDAETIDGVVKIESEEKSDGVVAEVQNVAMEVVKTEERKEKEVTGDGEKKENVDNGGAIDKLVAGETKAEKEASVSGSAIEVEQGIKPVMVQQLAGEVEQVIKPVEKKKLAGEVEQVIKPAEEKQLAGQVEQVIQTVEVKQLAVETKKTEKKEGGDNGQGIKPVEEKQLAEEPKAEKQNGEAVKLKEETQAKKEEAAAPKVEETQSSATPVEVKNVKDAKENAGGEELAVKDSK